jgi:solute carrier family 8 (sodium/calcium exchanger)
VSEGTAVLIAEVRRREGSRGRVGFRWRTVPGTAGDGDDYVGVDWQRLELADGETTLRIFVPLVNDGLAENPETFLIEIGRPDGGASLGELTRAEVVITDDDPR